MEINNEQQQEQQEEQHQSTELVNTNEFNPSLLLQMAVSKNLDIEKLEKLMELKDKWDAKQAKKLFYEAISKFQSIVPELSKSKQIAFGSTKYKFAPLGEIEAQIKGPMFMCGLSKRWELSYPDNKIQCDCIITHKDGHSEHTIMLGEKDTSGNKNLMQQNASAVTYLQRYTLIAALGLTTADEDNDGQTSGEAQGNDGHNEGPQPTAWLNEGTPEWNKLVVDQINAGVIPEKILADVKKQFRISKKQDTQIREMKPKAANPAAEQQAEKNTQVSNPAAGATAPPAQKKSKPKITAEQKSEWQALNEAEGTDWTKTTPAMKAYNNNVTKLASGTVSLKVVMEIYDLDADVETHYRALAKKLE